MRSKTLYDINKQIELNAILDQIDAAETRISQAETELDELFDRKRALERETFEDAAYAAWEE